MPRKYFSGGIDEAMAADPEITTTDSAMLENSLPSDGRQMVDFATLASTQKNASNASTIVRPIYLTDTEVKNYENKKIILPSTDGLKEFSAAQVLSAERQWRYVFNNAVELGDRIYEPVIVHSVLAYKINNNDDNREVSQGLLNLIKEKFNLQSDKVSTDTLQKIKNPSGALSIKSHFNNDRNLKKVVKDIITFLETEEFNAKDALENENSYIFGQSDAAMIIDKNMMNDQKAQIWIQRALANGLKISKELTAEELLAKTSAELGKNVSVFDFSVKGSINIKIGKENNVLWNNGGNQIKIINAQQALDLLEVANHPMLHLISVDNGVKNEFIKLLYTDPGIKLNQSFSGTVLSVLLNNNNLVNRTEDFRIAVMKYNLLSKDLNGLQIPLTRLVEALRKKSYSENDTEKFVNAQLFHELMNRDLHDTYLNSAYNRLKPIVQAEVKRTFESDRAQLTLDSLNTSMRQKTDKYMKMFSWNEANVQVLDKKRDLQRLIDEELEEGLQTGNFRRLKSGNYAARSNPNDVQRVVKRTKIVTSNPNDAGFNNNWDDRKELVPVVEGLMKAATKSTDKVYVLPYLLGPKGSPYSKVGIEITTNRQVAIQMMTLYNVGADALEHLKDSEVFHFGVNIPGDLNQIHKDIANGIDNRYFLHDVENGVFLSYGSAYGGNAILAKKSELRQGMWDSVQSILSGGPIRLSEHMFILQLVEKATGRKFHILGAFPSGSGKTNMSLIDLPEELRKKYDAYFISDDLANIYQNKNGELMAYNPEGGALFAIMYDTGNKSNSRLMRALKDNSGIIYTNIAQNTITGEEWWKGKTDDYPAYDEKTAAGWIDWQEKRIIDRVVTQEDVTKYFGPNKELKDLTAAERWRIQSSKDVWDHKNGRGTVPMVNIDNLSPDFYSQGVKIDAILWGGKNYHEPLIRQIDDPVEGVVDGGSAVSLSTAASAGAVNVLTPSPNAQDPFFGPSEGAYFDAWLETVARVGADKMPKFFHINQIKSGWKGYGYNGYLLDWVIRRVKGEQGIGRKTAIGITPTVDAISTEGVESASNKKETLTKLLDYDPEYWLKEEMPRRESFWNAIDAKSPGYKVPRIFRAKTEEIKERLLKEVQNDAAMKVSDKATLSNVAAKPWEKGGIDLNTSNGMQWKISKDGNGVVMNIDPAMIERIRREGIESLSPVIFRITPIASIWPLVGLEEPNKDKALA